MSKTNPEAGDTVKYEDNGKWKKAEIHGVRKVQTDVGDRILSYILLIKNSDGEFEQVDVEPARIEFI